jgi:hypothetical protein
LRGTDLFAIFFAAAGAIAIEEVIPAPSLELMKMLDSVRIRWPALTSVNAPLRIDPHTL